MEEKMQKLKVAATKDNLEVVTAFLDQVLDTSDCPLKTRLQIDLALEEMYINIANYAYAPGTGDMELQAGFSDDGTEVILILKDRGVPYDPLAKADPDVSLPADKRKIGGLGIFLVKKTMDSMSYVRKDGYNIVTMKKRFA